MNKITDLPEIEQHILAIRRLMITSMNGEVSDSMISKGVNYKKNFGVEIPRLRHIATRFPESVELADKLWESRVREMMILAIYLHPVNEFDMEKADKWMQEINQIELIEQYCMYLLSKLSFATELAVRWVNADEEIKKIAGFILATRIGGSFSEEQFKTVVATALANSKVNNFQLYKTIGNCLGRLCRRGEKDARFIADNTASMQDSTHLSEQYVFQEIKNELSFLYNL